MNYRGAYATIQWLDDNHIVNDCYFSFGGNLDDADDIEEDCFGIPDHKIFYFCDKGVSELDELKDSNFDFKVLDYELVEA